MQSRLKTGLIVSICILSLTSISCSAWNESECYKTVRANYPESEIVMIPGRDYTYLIKKQNGDILYVETMSITSTKITQEFTAFKGGE